MTHDHDEFFLIVKYAAPEKIQESIRTGADVNTQIWNSWPPLILAARNNQPEVIITFAFQGLKDSQK